ncbi:aminoglycoside phosphotransferase family protein [Mycetocola tolaasinivorans]|uniref:Aminoglycoside phosphotransferase family protein n=1 Tax=Mycetocola tolaasinivorans TaxID=76635 RepID=A0A3L7A8J5_9MICO|nr:aminoglycoside phosphotransferase family protein [Mycetocola tolaasinivorans]RLP76415.1 aminoglycoside phosphotransferase family protein [Mycetocola tolaasinivorans]
MTHLPAADIRIDEALVSELLRSGAPALAHHAPVASGEGFDAVMYRVGPEHAVRLPRRAHAADLIEIEQRWLPVLSEGIATQTPVALLAGKACAEFPRPWSIVPWIEGETVASMPVAERSGLAVGLARFVGDFQRAAPASAPANAYRGVPLQNRDHDVRGYLQTAGISQSDELLEIWEQALRAPVWNGPALWLHGDLHPGNLIARDGVLTGVIDFGDLTAGDPATDIATAWLTLNREDRDLFFEAIEPSYDLDEPLLERAQGWALLMSVAILSAAPDNPDLVGIARHTIAQLVAEERGLF